MQHFMLNILKGFINIHCLCLQCFDAVG